MKNFRPFLLIAIVLVISLLSSNAGISAEDSFLSVSGRVNGSAKISTLVVTANATATTDAAVSDVSVNQTVVLKNPTFQELKNFVLNDPTHNHPFVTDEYECRNFATDMINNAFHKGLLAGFVLICYSPPYGQHAVVAFNTTDRGLIYIEPQTGAAINIKVGGIYQGLLIKQILIAW